MKVIVALYDKKASMFLQPFFVPTVGVAYRTLQDEARRDPEFVVAKHPDDFALFSLGTFSESTGDLVTTGAPSMLIECTALLGGE